MEQAEPPPHPEAVVLAATDGRRARAEALLEARPAVLGDPWVRLVLALAWDGDPVAPGGPRTWPPLLYVCHSCVASSREQDGGSRAAGLAAHLLGRGADPNGSAPGPYGDITPLYGAAGVVHDVELTRLLLQAGADPDDGESVYHATESPSPACLRALLEHGAEANGTNALAHALDEDRFEHVRLLLEAGADPDDGALIAHAVRRGRGSDVVELLAAHGAALDRPGGETWRGPVPLRTPYQHAALRGRADLQETLARLGAATDVDPADLAVAAVAAGEPPTAPLPAELDVDAQEVLVLAALRGKLDAVVAAVGPNFRGVVGGSPELPLLAHAAWVGDPDVVGRLLAAGADPAAPAGEGSDTPLAVAALGSQYHALPGRDYVETARRLVAAGNPVEPRLLEVADGPLAAWLEQRLGGH